MLESPEIEERFYSRAKIARRSGGVKYFSHVTERSVEIPRDNAYPDSFAVRADGVQAGFRFA